jgi:cytosine/uracil/thiamine/allantoin permease
MVKRLINCVFLVVPVPKMKPLVYVKVFVYYGAVIAMMAWTVHLAGGATPALNHPSTIHGAEKSWMICKFIFLGLASCGTFISNAADLQRYARKPNDTILGQIISFPLSNLLVAIFGNIIASASSTIFGEVRITYLLHKGLVVTYADASTASVESIEFPGHVDGGGEIHPGEPHCMRLYCSRLCLRHRLLGHF